MPDSHSLIWAQTRQARRRAQSLRSTNARGRTHPAPRRLIAHPWIVLLRGFQSRSTDHPTIRTTLNLAHLEGSFIPLTPAQILLTFLSPTTFLLLPHASPMTPVPTYRP